MGSSKRKEIQKYYVKDSEEYVLERNRQRCVEECRRELLISFSLPEGTYWNSCSEERNEVGWLFEMSGIV